MYQVTRRSIVLILSSLLLFSILPATQALAETATPSMGTATSATEAPDFVRGAYGRDSSPSGISVFASTGFNATHVSPYDIYLDEAVAHGMKATVWLGSYLNETCSWERDEAWIRTRIAEVAGHPGILAYQLGDEPNAAKCPSAPAQYRTRHDLVKSLDPTKDTYTVISTSNGVEQYPYEDFAGTTDVMGIDVYPCRYIDGDGCKFQAIDEVIAEVERDGVPRYWAILQEFETDWYKLPTADQLVTQFDRWDASRMEGYWIYHWEVGKVETRPDHMVALAEQNARQFSSMPDVEVEPTPEPGPDTVAPSAPTRLKGSWQKSRLNLSWQAAHDDNEVAGYVVKRNGVEITRTTSLSLVDRPSTIESHRYEVQAFDASGNLSAPAALVVESGERRGGKTVTRLSCPARTTSC